jgi:hypothetical protein
MRKALLGALAVLLLAVGLVALWVYRSLDVLVERTVEQVGSELLGTQVSVDSADVELRAGRAIVRGIEVANPRGEGLAFSDEPAIRIGEVDVSIDVASLAASPIALEEVSVRDPFVNVEVTPSEVNLLALRRNLDRASPAAADAAAPGEAPRRFAVRRFAFEEGRLRADARAVGRDAREVVLPKLELREVGGEAGGTPGEIGKRVLEAFLARILAQVAKDRLSELIDRELDDLKEKAADALRSILGAERAE